jgi:2-C-methyl-D-erythritol 4-phosphate cytidylyltransferase/2-C-methyl-D-erythritol 2,4-cyclodiphosphate synthase
MKRIDGEVVAATVDRSQLGIAQTPQGFPADALRQAYRNALDEYTDDAALFQSVGGVVTHVLGEPNAFKITTPADLSRAESLFEREYRTGIGSDTHRFTDDPEKLLYLGTIVWEGERGLEGHSDGDALSHAIVDALLAAAGLGDIGSNFGVDREEFENANGSVFLSETKRMLEAAGWSIDNVSAQIIGNRPKVAPNRSLVQLALGEILSAPVSVGATTTDGLGFLGQTEGVAVVATALISRLKVRLNS